MGSQQVGHAFERLCEEITLVLGTIEREIADAAEARAFDEVDRLVPRRRQVAALRDDVEALRRRWETIGAAIAGGSGRGPVTPTGRMSRGERTQQSASYRPILAALARRGGAATASEVLDDIEREFADRLTEADLQPLPSKSMVVRWRNTAQWARNTLVEQGLMKRPRRRGLWEISEEGLAWLKSEESR
jgi:hypothetical protein